MKKITFCLAVAVSCIAVAGTASAATWGHLKGPFSPERQLTERINYAAQAREERSWYCRCGHSYRYSAEQVVLSRRY